MVEIVDVVAMENMQRGVDEKTHLELYRVLIESLPGIKSDRDVCTCSWRYHFFIQSGPTDRRTFRLPGYQRGLGLTRTVVKIHPTSSCQLMTKVMFSAGWGGGMIADEMETSAVTGLIPKKVTH